jgi:hypothetical protein
MRTLVLDLATHLGFAFGSQVEGVVGHGSFKLPATGTDIGAFLAAYRAWLTPFLAQDIGEVIFEMPILPATANLNTLRKLYSLCGVTELVAADDGILCREANLMDIRRHFIGACRAPSSVPKKDRREWLKDRTITECRRRGFRPADDNDADALALFSFIMSSRHPGFHMAGTEMARAA